MAQIIIAHVSSQSVQADLLPSLIQEVYRALFDLKGGSDTAPLDMPVPAVPIKKSVYPDYIVCLEDGKKFKMLKRHLHNFYNMTPDQYCKRWGLSHYYPMVSASYAARRSNLAKQMGLRRQEAAVKPVPRDREAEDA